MLSIDAKAFTSVPLTEKSSEINCATRWSSTEMGQQTIQGTVRPTKAINLCYA